MLFKYFKYLLVFVVGAIAAIVGERTIQEFVFSEYSNSTVLTTGGELEAALNSENTGLYPQPLVYQTRQAFCGVASVSNVLQSFGREAREQDEIVKSEGFGTGYWDVFTSGLTLEQLSELMELQGDFTTTIERPKSIAEMHAVLELLDDENVRIIVNYSRMPMFGKNVGHHTPIGDYNKNNGRVLLLDVKEGYGNYLVEPETLFVSISTPDSETGNQRGFLVVRKL